MNGPHDASANILEQIRELSREFRKQISGDKLPRIERYLSRISGEGRGDLLQNLLEIELRYRQGKGESPTSNEYVKRFPQFKKQVRRAFFEPTLGSVDSSASTDADNQTASLRNLGRDADAPDPTFELPDANRIGDYELIKKLGQGGMGIVHEARHIKTNNRVALKTLLTGGDGQQINADKLYRFRKEFRRLSEINHPNLVGMQSLEFDGDRWFFTMDLIDGENFLSYVHADDQLDEERLRACLKQLASGVMELHRRGIIHRDLKPSNVLVSPEGHVTILDFGLAAQLQRAGDMTQTKSGMFAGTPPYAAPEQMFGERTEASDWYAFGTMLFEALAGKRPFQDPDPMKLLRMKQEQDPPKLADRDGMPSDLSALTDGLLRREPSLRLLGDAIGAALGIEEETRVPGSTRGSQGSAGSVDAGEADLEEYQEEEIVLIGREKQLAQLEKNKDEFLQSRQPQVVWVTGLSGAGKSSLVEKFLRPIRDGNEMLVLSGRCYDRESVPFKAIDSIIDPLARFLRSRTDEEVLTWLPPDIEMLAYLFPVLRRVRTIDKITGVRFQRLDQKQAQSLAFAAYRDLLVAISQSIPIAAFVDDLQWGDADSAEMLVRILAPPKPPAILFLGSFRSDELDDSPFLGEWSKHISPLGEPFPCRRVTVDALTEEQCFALLCERFGETNEAMRDSASRLFESSKGNPYFLDQLIAGYDADSESFDPVPLPVMIRKNLDRCPIGAKDLLNVVAVAGKAVSVAEIADATNQADSALATITHMRSERLLRLIGSDVDQWVDTFHDKIRESVLDQMEEDQRRQLHLMLAESIERDFVQDSHRQSGELRSSSPGRVFDLARHYFEAGDRRAFGYQLHAAQAAIDAYAMDNALEHLKQAELVEPDNIDRDVEFRRRFMLGQSLSGVGSTRECVDEFLNAVEFADDQMERASALFAAGEARWKLGDYRGAAEGLRRAFRELGEKLPSTLIGKLIGIAASVIKLHLLPRWLAKPKGQSSPKSLRIAQMYPYYTQIVIHLDVFASIYGTIRGCLVARNSDDIEASALANSFYAFLLGLAGVPILPAQLLAMSKRAAGAISHRAASIQNYHLGASAYVSGRLDAAEQFLLEASHGLARADDWRQCMAVHLLRHTYSHTGTSSQIISCSTREIEIAEQTNERMVRAYGLYGLADGLSRNGECEKAIEFCRQAIDILEECNSVFKCIAYQELGRVQMQASDYAEAAGALETSVKKMIRLRIFEISTPALSLLAEAILANHWVSKTQSLPLGKRFKAKRLLCYSWIASRFFPNNRAHSHRVSGRLAHTSGRSKKAIKCFEKAVAAAAEFGIKYEHSRALIDKSLIDYGDADADRNKGLALLESLGCVLPDAEVEYLGIDREAHHFRAAMARAKHEAELEG